MSERRERGRGRGSGGREEVGADRYRVIGSQTDRRERENERLCVCVTKEIDRPNDESNIKGFKTIIILWEN